MSSIVLLFTIDENTMSNAITAAAPKKAPPKVAT